MVAVTPAGGSERQEMCLARWSLGCSACLTWLQVQVAVAATGNCGCSGSERLQQLACAVRVRKGFSICHTSDAHEYSKEIEEDGV